MGIRALSVRQPFAELIADGRKTVEVRSRRTHFRGPLLIVAGVSWHAMGRSLHGEMGRRGVSVCLVDLVDCRPTIDGDAVASCFPNPHGFAWVLSEARRVEAEPVSGHLGIFSLSIEPRLLHP